jgi:hypothetical protein
MAKRGADAVRVFARQVRARSAEHAAALHLVGAAGHHSVAVGILRQELDSMVRVMFLLANKDHAQRMKLIEDSVNGRRWRATNGKTITDRQMVNLANSLTGWAESVYRFGCAFIHLSNFHDRQARDPFKTLPLSERRHIISHVEHYHGRLRTKTLGIADLVPLIPMVFHKVSDNLRCYLDALERGEDLDA